MICLLREKANTEPYLNPHRQYQLDGTIDAFKHDLYFIIGTSPTFEIFVGDH